MTGPKRPTLYLSGAMTGLPLFNFPAFEAAALELRALGYTVATTAEGCEDTSKPWDWYMRRAIRMLLECDAVAVLPGWHESRGARLEVSIALALGMRVTPVECWKTEAAQG